ncbi:hypothetical protein RB195_018037 [Necator americanus]|uniref:Uncharacterized protein n=1 Tax=Necator americanus TaxID=51031 RepID=A0ABR1C7V9_NECAM
MLLRGLRACAERASKPLMTNLDRISKTTKELLERRRALRLDPNASHIERQKKILEAAQRRKSLKKCRRDLCEYNSPLAALLSEGGIRTSSHREIEITADRFYSNHFCSSTPLSSPIIPTRRPFRPFLKPWPTTRVTESAHITKKEQMIKELNSNEIGPRHHEKSVAQKIQNTGSEILIYQETRGRMLADKL